MGDRPQRAAVPAADVALGQARQRGGDGSEAHIATPPLEDRVEHRADQDRDAGDPEDHREVPARAPCLPEREREDADGGGDDRATRVGQDEGRGEDQDARCKGQPCTPAAGRAEGECDRDAERRRQSEFVRVAEAPGQPAAGLSQVDRARVDRSRRPPARAPDARTRPARAASSAGPRRRGSKPIATTARMPITANSKKPPALPSQLQPQASELRKIQTDSPTRRRRAAAPQGQAGSAWAVPGADRSLVRLRE